MSDERRPVAVIIGDIHFTPATLELASCALWSAIGKAERLSVPLVINGDTLDSKAIIRAECANRLIQILQEAEAEKVRVYINTGNHDLISEKDKPSALNFLQPYASVISVPTYIEEIDSWIVPYMSSAEEMQAFLSKTPDGSRLIIHQGVYGAFMGHYVTDKTSLPKEAYANFRVIASHYHRAQDIKCGRPRKGAVGLFSYVGNPYTLSFAEADDGDKGFQVLYDDGCLDFVPTQLRRHLIYTRTPEELKRMMSGNDGLGPWFEGIGAPGINKDDIVWLKVKGSRSELEKIDKKELGIRLFGHSNYKLDLIADDVADLNVHEDREVSQAQLLDELIERTTESAERKMMLKLTWRGLV